MVISDGIFWLARVQESSRGRRLSGRNANTVSQRRECPRTRHHQVGQPARGLDDHGVGVELGALPAGECPELLVSPALWWRWQAFETYWDCGGGSGSCSLPCGASSRREYYRKAPYSKRRRQACVAESPLDLGAGGGDPLNFRACQASRRIDGVASHRLSSSRQKTYRESGDGCLNPHG